MKFTRSTALSPALETGEGSVTVSSLACPGICPYAARFLLQCRGVLESIPDSHCNLNLTAPSVDDAHRFGLHRFQTVHMDVIQEIGDSLFSDKIIAYHPPCFVFHNGNKCLVKRK